MVKSVEQQIMMNVINLSSLSADEIDVLGEIQPSKYSDFDEFIWVLREKRNNKTLKFHHLSNAQYNYLVVGLVGKLQELYAFDTIRQSINN